MASVLHCVRLHPLDRGNVANSRVIGCWSGSCSIPDIKFRATSALTEGKEMFVTLLKDEQGASMAEYAMLLALIAVATIGAVQALRNQIIAVFNTSASTIGSAQ